MTPAEAAAIRARAAGLRAEARALEEFLDAQEHRTERRKGARHVEAVAVSETDEARITRALEDGGARVTRKP